MYCLLLNLVNKCIKMEYFLDQLRKTFKEKIVPMFKFNEFKSYTSLYNKPPSSTVAVYSGNSFIIFILPGKSSFKKTGQT